MTIGNTDQKTRTCVLVLGAGSSMPYGLPSGTGLRDSICKKTIENNSGYVNALIEIGYVQSEIERFGKSLSASAYPSVDVFLEKTPQYIDIGKAAIAYEIANFENSSRLFSPYAPQKNWCEYLVNWLEIGHAATKSHRIQIVTYNYDRVIEQYLTTVICERTSCLREEIVADDLPEIVHVHGSIGTITPGKNGYLGYGQDLRGAKLRNASKKIRIIQEAKDTGKGYARARKLISEAGRVCFLGFGYAQQNMERLRLIPDDSPYSSTFACKFEGTSMGISKRDWGELVRRYFVSDGNIWLEGPLVHSDVYDYCVSRLPYALV